MAITEHNSGTQTATLDTEHTLGSDPDTTDGVFQLWIDVVNMVRADRTVFRIYEKVLSAGTQRLAFSIALSNEQTDKEFVSPPFLLMHGWKMTLEQTDGTGRAFPWSIRKIA